MKTHCPHWLLRLYRPIIKVYFEAFLGHGRCPHIDNPCRRRCRHTNIVGPRRGQARTPRLACFPITLELNRATAMGTNALGEPNRASQNTQYCFRKVVSTFLAEMLIVGEPLWISSLCRSLSHVGDKHTRPTRVNARRVSYLIVDFYGCP